MPRSGVTGTYSLPPGTIPQQPNTPIESADWNGLAGDVQQTFNTKTPIAYGGTNAETALEAANQLKLASGAGDQTLTEGEKSQIRENIGWEYGPPFLHVIDQKTSGTTGGTSVLAGSQKRNLNTVRTNRITGASLSSNSVSLPAGTYYVEASAPAAAVGRHKIEIFNDTTPATILGGTSEFSAVNPGQGNVQTRSEVSGEFTLSGTTSISVYHYTELLVATIGIGIAATISGVPEVYTDLKIWKMK